MDDQERYDLICSKKFDAVQASLDSIENLLDRGNGRPALTVLVDRNTRGFRLLLWLNSIACAAFVAAAFKLWLS